MYIPSPCVAAEWWSCHTRQNAALFTGRIQATHVVVTTVVPMVAGIVVVTSTVGAVAVLVFCTVVVTSVSWDTVFVVTRRVVVS